MLICRLYNKKFSCSMNIFCSTTNEPMLRLRYKCSCNGCLYSRTLICSTFNLCSIFFGLRNIVDFVCSQLIIFRLQIHHKGSNHSEYTEGDNFALDLMHMSLQGNLSIFMIVDILRMQDWNYRNVRLHDISFQYPTSNIFKIKTNLLAFLRNLF